MRTDSQIVAYDRWLREDFRAINTELEEAVLARGGELAPAEHAGTKAALLEGAALVGAIGSHGEDPYELLGMVGFLLAAARRHGVDEPERPAAGHPLAPAWGLALELGAGLGVTPRYVFAHQAFHADGRTFTTLPEERDFTQLNGDAVLAYRRAAAALQRVAVLGVAHPAAGAELERAKEALGDVLRWNRTLAETVPVDRFFLNLRPYFKPHRVGPATHRGTNAGDFSAPNEIDVLLGLVTTGEPAYAALLAEKQWHVPPEDRPRMRALGTTPSLLDAFLAAPVTAVLRANAERFLAVRHAHGAATAFHHGRLVKPFLERPAAAAPPEQAADMSASGPPLAEVIAGLEHLRDLRLGRGSEAGERLAELRERVA